MSKKCFLLIGGARSGKSRFAQEMAQKSGETVLYVATAEAGDDEMKCRIEEHKRERPPGWSTLEAATGIGNCIEREIGGNRLVIVDCITLLVNNIFNQYNDQIDALIIEKEINDEINELVNCINLINASFIIVTNEVGTGLVPANRIGRLYRDLLGKVNQMLAEHAGEVYLMVAGIPLQAKP